MAMEFYSNWACTAIRDIMLQEKTDAKEVARVLSTQPQFLASIQEVIDLRNEPDYDPNIPGGDPAQAVIARLSEALVVVESDGWGFGG